MEKLRESEMEKLNTNTKRHEAISHKGMRKRQGERMIYETGQGETQEEVK